MTEHPKCCMVHHFQDKNSCTCRCHYGLTHEELLAKITPTDWRDGIPQRDAALRAVVQLHKPKPFGLMPSGFICAGCDNRCGCGEGDLNDYNDWFTCPTIQAIEKELA